MRGIGFTEPEIEQIWDILISVLLIGNVEYEKNESDEAEIKSESMTHLERAAQYLQIE
mgnify:CR=1 FL=1